jgi:hypothetical protein
MAKINSTKKIILEEFPGEVQGWLKKLVELLNRFIEQVYYALVNGLTIRDNLKSQVKPTTIAVGQTYPVKMSWDVNERPTAVMVAQITESANGTIPAYSLAWVFNNGTLELTFVGLDPTKKYFVSILGLV